jgi:hypothetical protein
MAQSAPGAHIELHVTFPSSWAWDRIHWQELWTIVQWQDNEGRWHDVEGWQGTLDSITVADDGKVTGKKTWWVGEKDLGTGPFRWRVYRGKGSWLLATSAPFDLPAAIGQKIVVEVSLADDSK